MANQPFEALGRYSRKILSGAGPHTPDVGMKFTHILPQAGAFKARQIGVGDVNGGHMSSTGVYTAGSPYAFRPDVAYPGDFDEVTGDASFFAIAYMAPLG